MWQSHSEDIDGDSGQKVKISANGRILTFSEVVDLFRFADGFRSFFNSLLVDAPLEAYRWETPAVSTANANRDFEFVLLDCPGLLTVPDPSAFAAHFQSAAIGNQVVAFPNLGKDAVLVVPLPLEPITAYGHLSAFVRKASEPQRHAWWQAVGEAMQRRISEKPVWLSTAGMGVPWLHARLDDRPKYYGHRPYRNVN
jgi:hypothetical protein